MNSKNSPQISALNIKGLRDFLKEGANLSRGQIADFKDAILAGPYQIGEHLLHGDLYNPPNSGIPIWRLAIYCEVANCTLDSFIKWCGFTSTPTPIFNSTRTL